jgi:nicotinamide phosphoribosyltransferase
MNDNFIMATDSYKVTHHQMYTPNTTEIYSYFECRNGAKFNDICFFGLQYIITRYFTAPITQYNIDQAEAYFDTHFGKDVFNRKGWEYILNKHNGYLPLEIRAIPEGTWVTPGTPLITVRNTDPNCAWLTNYAETILSQVWYPTTVATLSGNIKKLISGYFDETCDGGRSDPSISFMLHDFGFRGASSLETAGIGGMAHLVNFMGTDTLEALRYAYRYYMGDTVGFSVPATEHSIMTSDENGEEAVLKRLLDQYPSGILSVVADSYDIYNFVAEYMKKYKDQILARNGVFVVRPDSVTPKHPTPEDQVLWICNTLKDIFGAEKNAKGFYVINPKVKVLWGDGIDMNGIDRILTILKENEFAASNIATFGMGGGLLQKVNRDTLRCAFKCSNRTYTKDGAEVSMPVQKNPLDKSKASKAGKFDIDRVVYIKEMNDYEPTINAQDFSDVRSRASKMFV